MKPKNVSQRYSEVMALLPRLMQVRDAEDYVAGHTMLKAMKELGLQPVQKGKRLTVYDRNEVDAAIEKFKLEARKGK